ncbi:glycosyltransferase [Anabaena cylindrica FACHB-243]|uniref:Glycosyl transferase family 2 n=1 Tax=Anabaena cylindrica (strain ATCC 27899 / PCC 7122) TaxID=272123 RepID=K9ZH90_ANACC|nr:MULTISPECIES: glycosyltransferase [Anabaena]AFZ58608.1 glycosyl transferase family 2 [Anabaena cylindrica PCC 7122]MBD2419954.1 glycosyltransferase [Anabaena cylindrica FACHB-243]MBY5280643.1 glycosyltransferase [Anabaena sp. CCAP 1446/1C]MBY5311254.1 glycosyltransferase [Anabaena sp. CCAP 1446/1C]MCM2407153.1 glycosyltransferase [Anabaena sp. CCAP 1446/1C]
MSNPLLSIIIPTHNRPHLVTHAVKSALDQNMSDLEVIVVDDASTKAIDLPSHPQLRLIHLSNSHGGAGTRNVGLEAALGRWVTFLDDDDRYLPHMAEVSLEALSQTYLPAPVAVISGLEEVNSQGQVLGKRLPPLVRPRGAHFFLEELETGKSYNTKQTLVVERETLQKIGGWDDQMRSRVHSELFLRLNPVCSIIGLPIITYQLYNHEGLRVSRNPILRQESFLRLVHKHKSLFQAHPQMFAKFIYEHAHRCYELGLKREAFYNLCWSMQQDPLQIVHLIVSRFYQLGLKFASTNFNNSY